ncbi:hypothetical protein AB0L30_14360 [Microbispora rosea]|uniref:hypothetical protein n=1 Tax=Microbispora rosea TaxID=58117 RepID=UPI0034435C8C
MQAVTGWYALCLDGEWASALWVLPLQQFVYRQLMYLVVIQSVATAILGVRLRWHTINRQRAGHVGRRTRRAGRPVSKGGRPVHGQAFCLSGDLQFWHWTGERRGSSRTSPSAALVAHVKRQVRG